jgi:hypothetical protein
MGEGPLSLGVIGIFLPLFVELVLFGIGILKPTARIAKPCFSFAIIIFLVWSLWAILYLGAPILIRTALAIIILEIVGFGWLELFSWIDRNKPKQETKPSKPKQEIKPSPLIITSLLINKPYAFGTVLGNIRWSTDYRDLRVIFDNPSDVDYQDIDMTIAPDFPNIIIAAIGQITNISNVIFHNPGMQAYQTNDGSPEFKFDKSKGNILGARYIFRTQEHKDGISPLRVYPNYYRFRCDKLPRHMILEITIAIPIQDIEKQKGKINTVWVNGQYNVNTQTYNIDQQIKVSY